MLLWLCIWTQRCAFLSLLPVTQSFFKVLCYLSDFLPSLQPCRQPDLELATLALSHLALTVHLPPCPFPDTLALARPPQCSVQPSGWLSWSALHMGPPLLSAYSLPVTSAALLPFLVFFTVCLLCLSPDSGVALPPPGNTRAPQAGPWPLLAYAERSRRCPLPWLHYQPGLQPKPPLWFLTVHLLSSEQPPRRLPGTSTSAYPRPILSPPLFSSPVNGSSALAVVQTRKGGFVFDSSSASVSLCS